MSSDNKPERDDQPYLVDVSKYKDGPLILRVLCRGKAERDALLADPTVASFHWRWSVPWEASDPDHMTRLREALEDSGSEHLTPRRKAALEQALAEADGPISESELRDRAGRISDLSFGHGNQIAWFLKRAPLARIRQPNRHGRSVEHYTLQQALDPEYEHGPGRSE